MHDIGSATWAEVKLAVRTSLKWPILCRVGRKTLTQIQGNFVEFLLDLPNTFIHTCAQQCADKEQIKTLAGNGRLSPGYNVSSRTRQKACTFCSGIKKT